MRHPPTPTQKRYRGRIRSDMRSSLNHLNRLINWQAKLLTYPLASYPNQLAPAGEVATLIAAATQLATWLAAKGPIPSR